MLFRHAWKELRAQPRFVFIFVVNLALGLSGLITMEAFRASLSASLAENARQILSADVALSSRRPLTKEEEDKISAFSSIAVAQTKVTETFSMVSGPKGSRLVQLKAVEENFPLRGFLDLGLKGRVKEGQAGTLLKGNRVWVDPDLARQLGLSIGSPLKIGAGNFIVDDFVSLDPTLGFRALALSGRIIFSQESLGLTGLLRPESTVSFQRLYRLEETADPQAVSKKWIFSDPAIQVKSAGQAAEDSSRVLIYLGDFLGLSALVALFLSGLGSAYLYRTWLLRRSRTMAVERVLGLSFRQAAFIPALQSFYLSLAALPPALLLAKIELSALSRLVTTLAPVNIQASLSFSSVALAFLLSGLGSLLLALPFLAQLRSQNLRDLLGGKIPESPWNVGSLLLFLPSALLFYGLSVYESYSFRTAGVFFFSVLGSLGFLALAGLLFLRALGRLSKSRRFSWSLRHALLQLSRCGFHSLSAFVALALGTLLLNLLPQLREGLSAELETPQKLPSLFLFDIQEEQLSAVETRLRAEGLALENLSPLVRSRLLKVNGTPFERTPGEQGFRTREEEMEARFRNRGFNLTYRGSLSSSETLTAGEAFSPSGQGQISLEEKFAERLGLRLGDQLTFDVQGVEVEGKVVNFRQVKWSSFQPNFFVVFQPGALEGAPKIFLGSLPGLPGDKKERVQSTLAEAFPNISVMDVRSTVDRLLELADRMRWSLTLMSAISLFAGLTVLFAIAGRQASLRRWDVNLAKVLGSSLSEIRAQQFFEFGLLSFAAAAFGASLSVLFTWVASYYLFEGVFRVAPLPLVLSVILTTMVGILVSWVVAERVWRLPPAEILRDQPL